MLREQQDRVKLAALLPTIDGRTIEVPAPVFVEALGFLSICLRHPDWLTYQWGAVGPFRDGNVQHPFGLPQIVQLGLELRELSYRDNFDALLAGFSNPPQFLDTMFETHTASFFSRLVTTTGLTFSPERPARGRGKRPDFEVKNEIGAFLVECKRPHLAVQRAAETFKAIADAVHDQLKATGWPRGARIELEVLAPLREQPTTLAERVVRSALEAWRSGEPEVRDGPVTAFVVPRDSPFRIPEPKFWHDVMVLDSDEATGLFNPRMTMMRVAHNGLDHKFARSAGARLAEALRQLPPEQEGIIVLGEVPKRIAESAISRRISDRAYDHILAFVINEVDNDQFHFTYRTERRTRVQQLVGAGLRPLFAA
ncbi:MAG: hypothetical protein HY803_04805 [candidate division NC10 bacterium]|nr:hypothetical protein [candidate division NC10 bacterium]